MSKKSSGINKNDMQNIANKIKNEKIAAIRRAFSNIDKKTKRINTVFFGQDNPQLDLPRISTGMLGLDAILGGGIVKSRLIELSGAPSGGKTFLSLKIIAAAQQQGKIAAYIDIEGTYSQEWSSKLSVDTDALILAFPESAEECFEILTELIQTNAVDLIVVDSIAAMVTEQEFENDIGKQSIALLARFLSQELKKINSLCARYNTTCIMINQVRDNVGMLYGPATVTPGGKALKFYSSIRLEANKLSRSDIMEKVGNETVSVGHIIKIKLVKSKVSPPGRSCCVPIYFDGRQTDIVDELASIILANGLIPKYDSKGNLSESGRTYMFELEDEKLRITKQSDMAEALRQCPKIQQHFIDLIKSGNYSSTTITETENNEDSSNDDNNEENNYNGDDDNDNDNNEAEEIESFVDL